MFGVLLCNVDARYFFYSAEKGVGIDLADVVTLLPEENVYTAIVELQNSGRSFADFNHLFGGVVGLSAAAKLQIGPEIAVRPL